MRYLALIIGMVLSLIAGCGGGNQEAPTVANEQQVLLIEVTAYDPGISGTKVLRFTTAPGGYITRPTDTPANTYYDPRVTNPGNYQRTMFSNLTTAGSTQVGYGEVVLNNNDGGLDAMLDYSFDGRRIAILAGPQGGAYAEFVPVMVGTMQQVLPSLKEVTIRLRDRLEELRTPFQPTKYAGSNSLPAGLEGVSDLAGKPKPRLFGQCANISPVLVNTSRLIYQANDGALTDISAVYDKGAALTRGTDYTSQTDMETNAPAAGQYRAWLAGGYFRLGSSPAGQITADAAQGGTAGGQRSVGTLMAAIVAEKLAAADISYPALSALAATNTATVGIYVSTETTYLAVLDELAGSVGAWYGFDNLGVFTARRLDAQSCCGMVTDLADILSLERVAINDIGQGVPTWKVNLNYDKNYTVQTADLATTVTDVRKNWLREQYRVVPASNSAVLTQFPLAQELTVNSLFVDAAQATAEADRRLALYSVRRDVFRVAVPMQAFGKSFAGIWDTNSLTDLAGGDGTHYSDWSAPKEYSGYIYAMGCPDGYGTGYKLVRLATADPAGAWETVITLPSSMLTGYTDIAFHGGYCYIAGGSSTPKVYRLNLSNIPAGWDDAGVTDLGAMYQCRLLVVDNWLYCKTFVNSGTASKVLRLDLTAPTGAWDDSGVSDMSAGSHNPLWYYNGYIYTYFSDNQLYRINASLPNLGWRSVWAPSPPPALGPMCQLESFIYLALNQYYLVGSYGTAVYRVNLDDPSAGWALTGMQLPDINNRFALGTGLSSIIVAFNTTFPVSATYLWRPMSNYASYAYLWDIGRTVRLNTDRYGLSSRTFTIIGHQPDYQRGVVTLDVWG